MNYNLVEFQVLQTCIFFWDELVKDMHVSNSHMATNVEDFSALGAEIPQYFRLQALKILRNLG